MGRCAACCPGHGGEFDWGTVDALTDAAQERGQPKFSSLIGIIFSSSWAKTSRRTIAEYGLDGDRVMTSSVSRVPDFECLPVDRHVGGRLREMRVSRGLDVIFIARALGVPVPLVAAWEQGTKRIPADQMVALAELFFCPLAAFFKGMKGVCLEDAENLLRHQALNSH